VGELGGDWENAVVPEDAVELIISTTNDLVYTAEGSFTGTCDDWYVIVQYGESCCPVICMEKFIVDSVAPCVELAVAVVDSACDTACAVWISSDTCAYSDDDCPCTNDLECADCCTTFDWSLTVYDGQPFEEDDCGACVVSDCAVVVASDSGTGCSVDLNVFGCLTEDEWAELETAYYVIFTATDIVGNTYTDYGVLTVNTSDCSLTVLNDAVSPVTDNCDLESNGTDNVMGTCSACSE